MKKDRKLMKYEEEALSLGFKRKWLPDRSGYWLEKTVKRKGLIPTYKFSYEERFSIIEVMTVDELNRKKGYSIVWAGKFTDLKKKLKWQNKNKKK